VAGDFDLTVKVTLPEPKEGPFDAWAGVYLKFDSGRSYFEYTRGLTKGARKKEKEWCVWSQVLAVGQQDRVGQQDIKQHNKVKDVETATIRLTKRKGKLVAETDYGDGKWVDAAQPKYDFPDEVTIGLLVNGRQGAFTAEFEDFKLTPLK
jgi:regulation of enolase protein 1 (concanavalin A-like superfamily)